MTTERFLLYGDETIRTAAGALRVLAHGRSSVRGGASMFLGELPDGRFAVSSRFQYEGTRRRFADAVRLFCLVTDQDAQGNPATEKEIRSFLDSRSSS